LKKWKIIITDQIRDSELEKQILGLDYEVLEITELDESKKNKNYESADALLVWHAEINQELIQNLSKCKLIVRYGTGFDNIDISAAEKKNITVCNTPDYGVDEVADTACSFILNSIRQLGIYGNQIEAEKWGVPSKIELHRTSFHKLGVVGLGRIGTSVALKMKNFGMDVGFFDPYVSRGIEKSYGIRRFESLEDLQAFSTILTFHCPLNTETSGVINERFIELLNPGTVLINTARGGLISNLNAINDALKSWKISFLSLDVLPIEPFNINTEPVKSWLKNSQFKGRVTLTPHIAYFSIESYEEMRKKAAINVKRYFSGLEPLNKIV
jgi:lactate dehydrogenase-like 2-hydroxyacid dehydrogenase